MSIMTTGCARRPFSRRAGSAQKMGAKDWSQSRVQQEGRHYCQDCRPDTRRWRTRQHWWRLTWRRSIGGEGSAGSRAG